MVTQDVVVSQFRWILQVIASFEPRSLAVVHFWMPWSQPSVQMSEVLDEIAKDHDQVKFVKVSQGRGG